MKFTLFLAASFSAFAAERVTVVSTPDGGAVPDAEVAPDGAVHVAYAKGNDMFYVLTKDDGATWSAPLQINSAKGTAHPAHSFRGPDIALGTDGTVHVVWYPGGKHQGIDAEGGVRYARLVDGKFEAERNLNKRPSENFSLAVDGKNNVAVISTAHGVWVSQSVDGGTTFAEPRQIEFADNCECCATRVIFNDGALALAYRTKSDNQRDMFLAVSRDGKWSQDRASGTPWKIQGCPMTGTFLTRRDGGGTLMAMETKGAISWGEFGADGKKIRETPVRGAQGKYPIALRDASGATCVSWKDGNTSRWQLYSADGSADGSIAARAGVVSSRHAGVVKKGGGFLFMD
jgi:hypothetical protein